MPRVDARWSTGLLARLMVIVLLSGIAYRGWSHLDVVEHDGGPGGAMAAPAAQAAPAPSADYGRLAELHLFGKADAPDSQPRKATAARPALDLTLHGVVLDSQAAAAIIGAAGAQSYVRIGETVPGGGTLHAVHADRAIVERDGTRTTLSLLPLEATGASEPQPDPSSGVESEAFAPLPELEPEMHAAPDPGAPGWGEAPPADQRMVYEEPMPLLEGEDGVGSPPDPG